MIHTIAILAISSLAMASSPPSAQVPAQAPQSVSQKKICKSIPMIGSRLSKKRFCGTREEWAERQMEDRQQVEKMQTQVCVINGDNCK